MRNVFLLVLIINTFIVSGINTNKCDCISSIEYSSALDHVLKCAYIGINDGYFSTPDNGCIYDNKQNKLGNGLTYLIPNKPFDIHKMSDNAITNEIRRINSLTATELKNDFEIYIALVEKKYLKMDLNGELAYYPCYPYILKLIHYNKTFRCWCFIKEYNIKEIRDEQDAYQNIRNLINAKSKQLSGTARVRRPAPAEKQGRKEHN